jgi:hypothetical protein
MRIFCEYLAANRGYGPCARRVFAGLITAAGASMRLPRLATFRINTPDTEYCCSRGATVSVAEVPSDPFMCRRGRFSSRGLGAGATKRRCLTGQLARSGNVVARGL